MVAPRTPVPRAITGRGGGGAVEGRWRGSTHQEDPSRLKSELNAGGIVFRTRHLSGSGPSSQSPCR